MRAKHDTRLFFALWPNAELRRQLDAAADTIALPRPARRVPRANLHLTLHFIGNVHFDEMACMQRQARLVEAHAFQLELDCRGVFSRARVGWLGCNVIPDALAGLHRQLGTRLRDCGYRPEARPYHPHVTVARKLAALETRADFSAISWPVTEFVLVEVQAIENGVQYRVVETYPLT